MAWKYIVVQVQTGSIAREVPILFPEQMVHALVAEVTKPLLRAHGWTVGEVVAAGECTLTVHSTEGVSKSLKPNVYARDGDAQWLTMYPYHHGVK